MHKDKHYKCRPHGPFMRRRAYHPFMGMMPFMHKGMHEKPMHFLEEIESKEDAIDHLELMIKGVEKRRKHLGKKMKKLDIVEENIEEVIKEVGKMKEFSTEELKKILKKGYKEFAKRMIDEDDF